MPTVLDEEKFPVLYPSTKEVCELFDVTVLADLTDDGEGTPTYQVYALGWRSELSAGIRGGSMSPYFKTLAELEAFCTKHIERFREAADGPDGDSIPDSESWPV